jgi:two-component system phosphate regulon response regulator PhoB
LNQTATRKTTANGRTVLVVEDEQDLLDLLRYNLARDGYRVLTAESGETGLRLARTERPDLVLLDLMLPGMDGLEVCRALKGGKDTADLPIVMLTAKGEESDIVAGLELGADDYITKPFSPRVLIARLKAVLRRQVDEIEGDSSGSIGDGSAVIRADGLTIDPQRHEVRVDDQAVELTATEFKLLSLMASRPGRVFTRHQIIESIHEGYAAVTDRSVDVQVVALRRKLGSAGGNIQTVRGVGYRYKE